MKDRLVVILLLLIVLSASKGFAQHTKDTNSTIIIDPVPINPEFPGGDPAFKKFVHKNLHRIKGANGKKVFINFIVEKDGSLTHFKVVRGINKEVDEEALRVMRLSPKWKPVINNGKAEALWYTMPIVFPK